MSQTTSRLTAWYLSRNGAASGPFATDIVLSMLRDGQLQPLDLVFREGETEWRPAVSYAELKQKPQTSNQATAASLQAAAVPQPSVATAHAANAKSLQWIVLRSHNSTYLQEGPFETQTIIDGLQTGKFQFAQYAWHIGMSQWMRIGDLREFDRRSRARTDRPHVPPPLPDPIEAVLLEDDKDAEAEEFHVAMRGVSKLDMTPNPLESMQALNVTNLGNVGIGGAAAESPEEKTAQERASRAVSLVVSTPNLAGVPWEQDISDGYAQSRELIDDEHSGVHAAVNSDDVDDIFQSDDATNFASIPLEQVAQNLDQRFEQTLDKTPPPFVPPAPFQIAKDGWETWGRYAAGTALVAVIGGFSVYLMTATAPVMVKPIVQVAPVVPQVVEAPVAAPAPSVTSETNVSAAPNGTVGPSIALPTTTAPSDLTVTGLKLDRPDGQIIVQGSLPPDTPVHLTIKGRLGQVLSSMSVRKTLTMKRKAGELPSVTLKELRLPAGAYTVEAEVAGAVAKNEIFVGQRDAKFLDRLETHLREIALETQAQKKTLFYSAKELDLLARDLGLNYGQLRGKQEMWSAFYMKWTKRFDTVRRSLVEMSKKKPEEQAYPEETASLMQALTTMGDLATQYQEAIGQKRDIASDALTELIAELARQADAIGSQSARPTADTPDGML